MLTFELRAGGRGVIDVVMTLTLDGTINATMSGGGGSLSGTGKKQ